MSTDTPPPTPPLESAAPARAAAVPLPPLSHCPIVGIGASTGGLAAFEAFFAALPTDPAPGMAFVLVQHLSPDHKSLLTELVQRCTRLPVCQVEDGMTVEANRVYIIPPGHDMAIHNGNLQLLASATPHGQRLPIDFFFHSLALDQGEQAIGIVMSGAGSDGSLGLRAIKANGGMVMAQSPDSAQQRSMPDSALATGLVDYVLEPRLMPEQLQKFLQRTRPAAAPQGHATASAGMSSRAMKKIFFLLQSKTGHDFAQYKPNTLHRRIGRRMAVHQIDTLEAYIQYLHEKPGEVEALFLDLLIGVTHFFRDTEAFKTVEDIAIPKLFEGKPPGALIRIWVCGCSTGEEAYTLAMLLQEHADALHQGHRLQVFATDIDAHAIATARAGVYPPTIAHNVAPQRLARFFTQDAATGSYRINKAIRDLLVFSEQDVIKDPPFSRLDMISCRNLLIYLGASLQKKLIQLFHYALNPGGVLFLGASETVGEAGELFVSLDRKAKLYQRKGDRLGAPRHSLGQLLPYQLTLDNVPAHIQSKSATGTKPSLREAVEQLLLTQAMPSAALVNSHGDTLYLHGRAGTYLEVPAGEPGQHNLLKMAREGLRRALTTALHKAVVSQCKVRFGDVQVQADTSHGAIDLSVIPVHNGGGATTEAPLYLVLMQPMPPGEKQGDKTVDEPGARSADTDAYEHIAILNQELRAKEEYLQTANEELETSNEELKSSNEEMQSINEELQSTNEELETSKEELQSVNEELATLNTELQAKVADLSRANNDMNNLLAGTGMATVFVDHQQRILRFTPAATRIINLIAGDVGRPVGHIVANLVGYERLLPDLQQVLDTLVPKEMDVQTRDGHYFSMRIQPYRTLDNVIEGAVISFFDITAMRRTQEALATAEAKLQAALAKLPPEPGSGTAA